MNAIRSALAWSGWLVATIVFGTLALLLGLIPPRGRFFWLFARAWSQVFLTLAGVKVEREGPELPSDRPFVFVGNHESLLDIPLVFAALPRPARFLAKKILFHIPFVGWNMTLAGFIPIDRSNRKKAVAALEAAARRMREGNPILVFPEETRSPDGVLLPFQRGAFLLAIKAQIAVVPMAIEGSHLLLRKGGWIVRPGTVTVRWGEPIETSGMHHKERDALIVRTRAEVLRLRGGGEAIPKDVATQSGKEELTEWRAGGSAATAAAPTE